jgi:hypothetical protein
VSRTTQDHARKSTPFLYRTFTFFGLSFQIRSSLVSLYCVGSPITPILHRYSIGLGSCAFARHYLRNHFCFLLLWVLRCFSSPRSPSVLNRMTQLHCAGFPHSDISGSTVICTSPKLFAACHVLLRLPEPRHPPFALFCFFISSLVLFLLLLFSFFKLVKDLLLASLLSSLHSFLLFLRSVTTLSYLSLSWLKIFFLFSSPSLLSFFPFFIFFSLYRRFFTFFFFCCRNSLASTLSFSFLLAQLDVS